VIRCSSTLRKGYDGLYGLVQTGLGRDPLLGISHGALVGAPRGRTATSRVSTDVPSVTEHAVVGGRRVGWPSTFDVLNVATAMPIDFGYYPFATEFRAGDITISVLPGLDDKIRSVTESGLVHDRWCYAPVQRSRDFFTGQISMRPYRARVFGLPKTHRIAHAGNEDPARLRFVMHCFGFFEGMRMDDTGAGFLDATPIEPGILTDFRILGDDLGRAMQFADQFWARYAARPEIATTLLGVFQSLSLSHAQQALAFEEYLYACIALEGTFAVGRATLGVNGQGLRQRITNLCAQFEIPIPRWLSGEMTVKVAGIRNDLVHEGLFVESPLGFASLHDVEVPPSERYATRSVPFAMRNLVCRLVMALLGMLPMQYLASNTYETGTFRIEL